MGSHWSKAIQSICTKFLVDQGENWYAGLVFLMKLIRLGFSLSISERMFVD